jgi:ubiquinone/menaquinone biosynthesis C-methylase UbiE
VNASPATLTAPLDLAALKKRQMSTWASGDYAVIGTTLQIAGETLAEACDVNWDERVLDIAAGNGNATLAAARRGARVTSTDYVPALLERGAERARAERLNVAFQTADAEALPFEDGSFDVVLSTFGAMFSPDHNLVASQMTRVCRPGGESASLIGRPKGSLASCSKRWDAACRRLQVCNHPPCGELNRTCKHSLRTVRLPS